MECAYVFGVPDGSLVVACRTFSDLFFHIKVPTARYPTNVCCWISLGHVDLFNIQKYMRMRVGALVAVGFLKFIARNNYLLAWLMRI